MGNREIQEMQIQSLDQEDPWRRKKQSTLVFLPGKFHEKRSLAGYSLKVYKESDMTELLSVYVCSIYLLNLSLWIGEENGSPLQYSCLENPRDGGAWWAAISGVAQSWTRLRRLSSSSSVWIFLKYYSRNSIFNVGIF